MANRRIKDQTTTRLVPLGDDFIVLDGDAGGSAKMLLKPALLSDIGLRATIGDGVNVITTGVKGVGVEVPCDCDLNMWTLLADVSGSILVDIWKGAYSSYPPVVGGSITASAKPTISSALKGQSSTLTGWTTALTKGDILRFNVDSVATVKLVSLNLRAKRRV